MKFIDIHSPRETVSFKEALLKGSGSEGGLYVPGYLPRFSENFLNTFHNCSLQEIGLSVLSEFIDDIPQADLQSIITRSLNFPIPLIQIEKNLFLLELFHGPTLAFKDVGARFMAEILSYFLAQERQEITIMVATSGDTGSAVAHGFYNIPHIKVVILYPSGKISRLQEQQMTTLGGNVSAIEVEGTFDDCQRLVKQSLIDDEIKKVRTITTANSINLGRLLPQIVYYVWGIAQLRNIHNISTDPIVVVPSGNFGNLTAGLYANAMGMPVRRFIAATNANDVVPQYLLSGSLQPRDSIQTYSNAMDVGNPSNLARIQFLFKNDISALRKWVTGVSISDEQTIHQIRATYEKTGYVLDPHTAVGVAAARKSIENNDDGQPLIITATAHPAKFPEVIRRALGKAVPLPSALEEAMNGEKQSEKIPADYSLFKTFLCSSFR